MLESRLDLLHDSLARIKGFLSSVESERIHISEFRRTLLGQEAHPIAKTLEHLRQQLDESEKQLRGVKDKLNPIERGQRRLGHSEDADQLRSTLEKITECVQAVSRQKSTVDNIDEDFNALARQAENLDTYLLRIREDPRLTRLEQSIKGLFDDTEASIKAIKDKAVADPAGAWRDYQVELNSLDVLLSESLDLISGLALRDVGLDQRVGELAEELICHIAATSWENSRLLLSIPSRHKAIKEKLGRVVRLSYPHWTVWSLPQAAHELWHVLRSEQDSVVAKALVQKKDLPNWPHAQDCLADIFATYLLGPAYAAYAILIGLDSPASQPVVAVSEAALSDSPGPAVALTGKTTEEVTVLKSIIIADRAKAVLSTLRRLNLRRVSSESRPERGYDDVYKKLCDAWDSYLEDIGARAEHQNLAAATGGRPAIDQSQEVVDGLIEWLVPLLESKMHGVYTPQIWEKAGDWTEFLQGARDPQKTVTGDESPSLWLSAVWRARLANPEKTSTISEHALDLWRLMRPRRSRTTPPPGAAEYEIAAGSR